ncbi:hypothetical protein VNO78_16184 [Psophocarpus tetragonolobus]|uniref:Uncharacterized protein n=1 Tax=Psophocarpus tetragonolobus TaxID=3891 RepID=A0AAN9SHV5_PSOTE
MNTLTPLSSHSCDLCVVHSEIPRTGTVPRCCGCVHNLTLATFSLNIFNLRIVSQQNRTSLLFADMDSSENQEHQHGQNQSQKPSYDQSSQPYYPSNQPQFQQHPNSIPVAPEPSQPHTLNPVQPAPVAGSLNPDAVAVVTGALTQLVGNVDGGHRERVGPSHYRGAGRRGGRFPFRGLGRGRFNHHRGRGRGRGGDGKQFSSHSTEAAVANVADPPAADGTTLVAQPSSVSGQSSLPNPSQVPSASSKTPCKLWCDICKAECNTPEMLEQHKNGKRHKKNLRVHEELQRFKALNGQQGGNISTSQSNLTIHPEKVQESENKGLPEENMSSEATTDNDNDETKLQNNTEGVSEVQTEEPQKEPGDNSAKQVHGSKRKMKGSRGGKYMRNEDGSRKAVEPPNPKQVTSFICELCNVKCDSPVVYNSHLIGKKHLLNVKRVYGHQALNGEAVSQPLHPPDMNAVSNANNFPVQQGVSVPDPQNLLAQILLTVLSHVQLPAAAPLPGPSATQIQAPTLMAGSSHESPSKNLSQTQVSDSLAYFEGKNPTGETKDQMSPVTLMLDQTAGSSNNGNFETADGTPAKEEMAVKLSQNASVMTPTKNLDAANKQVPS